jgi:hypothetical protein
MLLVAAGSASANEAVPLLKDDVRLEIDADPLTSSDLWGISRDVEFFNDAVKIPSLKSCQIRTQDSYRKDAVYIDRSYYPIAPKPAEFHPDYIAFVKNQLPDSLRNIDVNRLKPLTDVCGKPGFDPSKVDVFFAYLFEAISGPESSHKLTTRMWEKSLGYDPVTHRPVWSEGLLQLSYADASPYKGWKPTTSYFQAVDNEGKAVGEKSANGLGYGCDEIDWEADKKKDALDATRTIYNPFVQLSCGMRIFERLLTENRDHTVKDKHGNRRCPQNDVTPKGRKLTDEERLSTKPTNIVQAGGCYWSAIRPEKRATYASIKNSLSRRKTQFCNAPPPPPPPKPKASPTPKKKKASPAPQKKTGKKSKKGG